MQILRVGILALLPLIVLVALACGASAPPTPVPAAEPSALPPPTPNLEATVEAMLQATLAARPTATAVPTPEPTATPIPIPTLTPTPTPMPTALPTATPRPEPTSTPIPEPTTTPVPAPILEAGPDVEVEPPSVYGRVEVRIVPGFGGGIVIPDSAIQAGFVVESADGEEIFDWITDPEPYHRFDRTNPGAGQKTRLDFALTLAPGEYKIVGLIGMHPDLAKDPVGFPSFRIPSGMESLIGNLSFSVPESGCIYIGDLSLEYLRIPPGSRTEQNTYLDQEAERLRDGIHYSYLRGGSLISISASIDNLTERDSWDEEPLERGCRIKSTKWIFG